MMLSFKMGAFIFSYIYKIITLISLDYKTFKTTSIYLYFLFNSLYLAYFPSLFAP